MMTLSTLEIGRFSSSDGVLKRYRKFNNPQGNSASNQGSGIIQSATNVPDSEDLNRDNTLNEAEAYYEYEIPLLSENGEIQRNPDDFITDTISSRTYNGQPQTWYRFKIPLDQFTNNVGNVQDFRSIRFVRIYMREFEDPVTLRFARFDLVRNQWRRYFRTDTDIHDETCLPASGAVLDINDVNFEENANRTPFPYMLPPGISREQSIGNFADALQNEQSLAMEISGLDDGESKSIFKILNMDMRFFERLKMFVHVEAPNVNDFDDDETEIFMRLGSDFEQNYYEYRIPLKLSRNLAATDLAREVWKEENEFDFPLSLLTLVKEERNRLGLDLTELFTLPGGDPEKPNNRISVKGNPNLGRVKSIMIGIHNKCGGDDVGPLDLEVWINELRVNGFKEDGGLAALAKVDMKLADLGGLSSSLAYSGIGYGGLEDKILERSREEIVSYDVATQLELGKFFSEKTGLQIPFYAQYSNVTKNPLFDPYDLDVKLKDKVKANPADAAEIKEQAKDITTIKSYNFTKVRKNRTNNDSKPKPWNIENFSLTYAYTNTEKRNPIIEKEDLTRHSGELDYRYSAKPKYIKPFKKLIKKDKYLKFISEFNFNPIPNKIAVNTGLDRQFNSTKYRFSSPLPQYNTFYNKFFLWDRDYNLNWDLSKALNLKFNALNESVIDEPAEFDTDGNRISKQVRNDSIWTNIRDLGRTKNYGHNLNLTYNVPFKNFPFLEWINVKAQYSGSYGWTAAALNVDSLGHVINNSQRRKIDGDFNLESLYNKWGYLKKINSKRSSSKTGRRGRTGGGDSRNSRSSRSKRGDDPKGGSKESGKDSKNTKSASNDGRGGNEEGATRSGNISRSNSSGTDNSDGNESTRKDRSKKDKDGEREISLVEKILIRPLLTLRKIRVGYSEDFTTIIPGYTPDSKFFGQSEGFDSPGWDFVAGWQPNDAWFDKAIDKDNNYENSWITNNFWQNRQVQQTYSKKFDGRLTLEPFNDFRIDVEASLNYSENHSESLRDAVDDDIKEILRLNPREVGSYTISYYTLNTFFNNDINGLFKRFENNRPTISYRLAELDNDLSPHETDSIEYYKGYGRQQQDVIIPAFLAAYTGEDPATAKLDVFKTTPRPNWNLSYSGLSKLPWFKDRFKSISLKHSYKSSLTINSFDSDLLYDRDNPTSNDNINEFSQNYYSRYSIPTVVISERLAPLVGIDVKLNNSMSFKFDYNKQRDLAFNFTELSLAETNVKEFTFGFGYKLDDVKIPYLTTSAKKKKRRRRKKSDADEDGTKKKNSIINFGSQGNKDFTNEMIFTFDFSLRDDITLNHYLDRDEQIPTRGSKRLSILPSIDYTINRRLKLRLFFERNQTIPYTSAGYPITNSRGGVTITFSLN